MRNTHKNVMRSAKEKEKIVLESIKAGTNSTISKYGISKSMLYSWKTKYKERGIKGLESLTGKSKKPGGGNPLCGLQNKKNKTKEEELQLKVMKLEIELARLKKGYLVRGVGTKKEYVTIKDLNMKS